jgi:ribonuclease D
VQAAVVPPQSRGALGRLPAFATRSGQRYLRQFWDALMGVAALTDDELPPLVPRSEGPPPPRSWTTKHPAAARRLGRCREAVRQVAKEHDLPQENLLLPDVVRRLAWQPPPEPRSPENVAAMIAAAGARPWQVELTSAALADALSTSTAEPG